MKAVRFSDKMYCTTIYRIRDFFKILVIVEDFFMIFVIFSAIPANRLE